MGGGYRRSSSAYIPRYIAGGAVYNGIPYTMAGRRHGTIVLRFRLYYVGKYFIFVLERAKTKQFPRPR